MPPKKASTGAPKKAGGSASHASYRDMIKDAILSLKERNGSSRQSIKKYVMANNKISVASQNAFDAQFNKAIKVGVEKGEFIQPKGPSGPVKLAKKEPTKPTVKTTAKPSTKKAQAKKAEKPTTKTATKKTAAPKKTAAKPKANTAKPRKASASTAPAVVDQPKVLGKTKSGRVTKTPVKSSAKKGVPKKKASEKKSATPKKTET